MPEQDDERGELDKAEVIVRMMFIANYQSAKVVEPGKQALYFPATLEAAQCAAILSLPVEPTALTVRCDHLGAELMEHLTIQFVAVVSFVANQPLGDIGDEALLQCLAHQLHFSWASTLCAYGDRKTIAVCNCHDLGALAAFSLSHTEPPFLAGAKLPSIKVSLRSIPPRSLRSCATASSTCSRTFERTQFWKRRCTVWKAPYRRGKSFHGAPVRSIHRIPFSVVRR